VIEATPKCGKTVGCMAWLTEQAVHGRPSDHYWWVAPVAEQARMVFDRLLRAAPPAVARSIMAARPSRSRTTPPSASRAPTDALYGEDVVAAVIDEAPRCKEAA
jgi:hypothetical protein